LNTFPIPIQDGRDKELFIFEGRLHNNRFQPDIINTLQKKLQIETKTGDINTRNGEGGRCMGDPLPHTHTHT